MRSPAGRRWWFAATLAVLPAHPDALAQTREERLAFLGDTGTGGSSQRAVRDQLLRFPHSKVFLLGDNVYDWGDRRRIGEVYDEVYAPVMSKRVAFHAALGNHDVRWCDASLLNPLPAGAEAYQALMLRCDVPNHLAHPPFGFSGGRRYYSVASAAASPPLVEVFVLDSNTLRTSQSKLALREDSAQLSWLDSALLASRAHWKVVVMHHPPHSPRVPMRRFFFVPLGGGRARESRLDQQLKPILRRHRVDAVIAAHNHFYARMAPQEGIRYFVAGGGGRKVYDFSPEPGYALAGGGFHHFLHLRVTESGVEYYAIDDRGVSRDAGWWAKGDAADRPLPRGALPMPR